MQIVTANAACAIALRNVVFKLVPKAVTSRIEEQIKDVILGKASDFETTKKIAVEYFTSKGVSERQILSALGKEKVADLDRNDVFVLRGTATAIKEGDVTLAQAFIGDKAAIGKGTRKMHGSFGNRDEDGNGEGES
jgi:hypothetical protein